MFSDAEGLDIGRSGNDHIAFGGGIHYCVGAPLAKVELEAAYGVFARRVAEFELAEGDLPRVPSLVFRGVRSLP
ncbi:MAG: cytochrome P450, partial [Actinobacteria bacterium]|nr:cytochrome P450 [Actinomycetota bacterium]NIT97395.1 cytochrome P450 [Actinomycetota bacterium]NIU21064.1 cytochrome P450 [Actinomycetota bacterium]NIU69106.1 cytochrome P450 [Actinomycetota bacterium]NIV89117.1 cytochrome P450 [Actinomycetota bacterium]